MNDNTITGLLAFVYTLLSKFDIPSESRTMLREALIGAIAAAVNEKVTEWQDITFAVEAKTISGDNMKPNSAAAMRTNVQWGIDAQREKRLGEAVCQLAGVELTLKAVKNCKYTPRSSSRRGDMLAAGFEAILKGRVQTAEPTRKTLI